MEDVRISLWGKMWDRAWYAIRDGVDPEVNLAIGPVRVGAYIELDRELNGYKKVN